MSTLRHLLVRQQGNRRKDSDIALPNWATRTNPRLGSNQRPMAYQAKYVSSTALAYITVRQQAVRIGFWTTPANWWLESNQRLSDPQSDVLTTTKYSSPTALTWFQYKVGCDYRKETFGIHQWGWSEPEGPEPFQIKSWSNSSLRQPPPFFL